MSAIDTATANLKAPIGWAKARPLGWVIFVFVIIMVTLRFREKIAGLVARIPVVGKWLTGIAAGTAAALAMFATVGGVS